MTVGLIVGLILTNSLICRLLPRIRLLGVMQMNFMGTLSVTRVEMIGARIVFLIRKEVLLEAIIPVIMSSLEKNCRIIMKIKITLTKITATFRNTLARKKSKCSLAELNKKRTSLELSAQMELLD